MARAIAATFALSLTVILTGCGGTKKQAGAGTAEGEVLPASASDAMLPLDTVKSQPPLAPRSDGSDKPGSKDGAVPRQADDDGPAAPAPAEEPAPPAQAASDE